MSLVPSVLIALLSAVSAAAPDPKALVARLGAADPAERDEAAASLVALGRDALPALVEAARGDDRDVGTRASAVWETIQRGRMTRPSLVRLDGRNRILKDVLSDLQAQTGMALRTDSAAPPGERIGVHEPEPVPFWAAVEGLGLNAVFYHQEARGRFPVLELRGVPPKAFTSVDGMFRVSLIGVHLHRDRQLVRGSGVQVDRFGDQVDAAREGPDGAITTYFGGLEVMAEPRVWFTQEADARLTEATDDLGQSLVPDPPGGAAKPSSGGQFAFAAGSGVAQSRTEFRLRLTERRGRTARLRGVVPLMLHLRRPAPALVIPLAGAVGKTFPCDDAEFTIDSADNSPNGTNVSMTVRINVDKADLPDNPVGPLVTTRLRVLGEHQLELVDAKGTVLAEATSSGYGGGSTPAVYHWTINTFRNGHATHLRYYRMLRARADAAFDFRDVPLP